MKKARCVPTIVSAALSLAFPLHSVFSYLQKKQTKKKQNKKGGKNKTDEILARKDTEVWEATTPAASGLCFPFCFYFVFFLLFVENLKTANHHTEGIAQNHFI